MAEGRMEGEITLPSQLLLLFEFVGCGRCVRVGPCEDVGVWACVDARSCSSDVETLRACEDITVE